MDALDFDDLPLLLPKNTATALTASSSSTATTNPTQVYSVTANSWMSEPVQTVPIKKKARSKEPIYPIFLTLLSHIEDEFWIEKFTLFAHGKLPRDFKIQNGSLVYIKGLKQNKTFRCETNPDINITIANLIAFFSEHGGIRSPNEKRQVKEIIQAEPLTWEKASKKTRQVLLVIFVDQQCSKYNLDVFEYSRLKQLIYTKGINKFLAERIRLKDNHIAEITGLCFDETKRSFSFNEPVKLTRSSRKQSTDEDDKKSDNDPVIKSFMRSSESLRKRIDENDAFIRAGRKLLGNNKPRTTFQIYRDNMGRWLDSRAPVQHCSDGLIID